MYFGETDEEIYENVKNMNHLARKVARIFRIIAAVAGGLLGIAITAAAGIGGFLFAVFFVVVLVLFLGEMGKNYAWGWIWYKSKHNTKNLASDVAGIAKDNVTVSYIIGGKGAAKWSIIGMLVALGIQICIGFWAGTYYRIKFEKKEKQLAPKVNA
ncbi:MAG: hypothetical protein ACI4N4_04765 [Candidatus Fimenecus sp.]